MKHHGWSRKDNFKRGGLSTAAGVILFLAAAPLKNYGVVLDVSLCLREKCIMWMALPQLLPSPGGEQTLFMLTGGRTISLTCMEKL